MASLLSGWISKIESKTSTDSYLIEANSLEDEKLFSVEWFVLLLSGGPAAELNKNIMVLLLDGYSWMRKVFLERKKLICDYSRSNQKPLTDHLTKFAPYLCTISDFPSNISTMKDTRVARPRNNGWCSPTADCIV